MCEAARSSGVSRSREEQQEFPPLPSKSFQSDLALWYVQARLLSPVLHKLSECHVNIH